MDKDQTNDSTRTHFVESGSIPKPGPIGRLVRLLLGYFCLYFFWQLVTKGGILIQVGIPNQAGLWIGAALAFLVFPYVVSIGFRRDWGRWPQAAILLMAMAASGASLFIYGSVWGPPVAWLVVLWLVYVYGHLGLCFALSGLFATPGCEMRAIPHLIGQIFKQEVKEHVCPGPLGPLDRWEARKYASKSAEKEIAS